MQCTSELWKLCSRTYCAPISIILELPPLKSVGLPGPSFIHLLFETQGWEVAILNWPLHVRRGRHPNAVSVLQHLRSCGHARFWSDGNSSLCKDIRALSNTHPLCVHRLEFLGECPSNPYLSSPLKFLPDHPSPFVQPAAAAAGFHDCANVTEESGRKGSHVYEVNLPERQASSGRFVSALGWWH